MSSENVMLASRTPACRCETPRSLRVVQVIEVVAVRGYGIKADPIREVTQVYSMEGRLLAEQDPSARDQVDALANFIDGEQAAFATYLGGYKEKDEIEIFHHGMATVFNMLRALLSEPRGAEGVKHG